MASCGISVNVSNLGVQFQASASAFKALAGLTGVPVIGIAATAAQLIPQLTSIQGLMNFVLPAIPLGSTLTGLRDQFSNFVNAGVGTLTGLLEDFGDITGLAGYANIDLTNLANSALGFSGTFDPCNFGDFGIPNVVRDASGSLRSLANFSPNLGVFSFAAPQSIFGLNTSQLASFNLGNFSNVTRGNLSFSAVSSFVSDPISGITSILPTNLGEARSLLQTNIVASGGGLAAAIRVTSTGEMIVREKQSLIDDIANGISESIDEAGDFISSTLFDEDGDNEIVFDEFGDEI